MTLYEDQENKKLDINLQLLLGKKDLTINLLIDKVPSLHLWLDDKMMQELLRHVNIQDIIGLLSKFIPVSNSDVGLLGGLISQANDAGARIQ